MRKREKPQEEGAPAYMAQYTALMTILLAFFICMLTLGDEKAAKYKKEGFGYIKDSFGLSGGLGLLPYWKAIMKKFPEYGEFDQDKDKDLLGYVKGSFESEELDAEGILKVDLQNWGYRVKIPTPITFAEDDVLLSRNVLGFLDRVGGVLYNLTNHMVTACCYETRGSDDGMNQIISARRAAAITSYLKDRCGVPGDRLNYVGYSSSRYLGSSEDAEIKQGTVFFVRKIVNETGT